MHGLQHTSVHSLPLTISWPVYVIWGSRLRCLHWWQDGPNTAQVVDADTDTVSGAMEDAVCLVVHLRGAQRPSRAVCIPVFAVVDRMC